jgi:dTDP-glucose 4,6-dehydratase
VNDDAIRYVADRKGHDRRYAIDPSRAERELGFAPRIPFEEGLRATIRWYLDHQGWVQRVRSGDYRDWYRRIYGG